MLKRRRYDQSGIRPSFDTISEFMTFHFGEREKLVRGKRQNYCVEGEREST